VKPDRLVLVGMLVAAASAAVASFTGLRGLALMAGWPDRLAWLLPLTIDAYAMTSARVWLAQASPARRFARANAIGAIAASIAGNAAYHLNRAGLLAVSWPIVVLVGAVPAAVLGLTAHLHALRSAPAEPAASASASEPVAVERSEPIDAASAGALAAGPARAEARPGESAPGSESGPRPEPPAPEDLMAAARRADADYRATHDGRPITRDGLRAALHIAGTRATELRRQLIAERATDRKEATTTR